MPARPAAVPNPYDPVIHDLSPLPFEGQLIPVRLRVRRTEDGMWRAGLLFGMVDTEAERATAEIFCATSEQDLWESVQDLRDHHFRDLYRSLL